MGDQEEKEKHMRRRKRNILAKDLRDTKGPFKMKVIDPRKQEYKRIRINVKDIDTDENED